MTYHESALSPHCRCQFTLSTKFRWFARQAENVFLEKSLSATNKNGEFNKSDLIRWSKNGLQVFFLFVFEGLFRYLRTSLQPAGISALYQQKTWKHLDLTFAFFETFHDSKREISVTDYLPMSVATTKLTDWSTDWQLVRCRGKHVFFFFHSKLLKIEHNGISITEIWLKTLLFELDMIHIPNQTNIVSLEAIYATINNKYYWQQFVDLILVIKTRVYRLLISLKQYIHLHKSLTMLVQK